MRVALFLVNGEDARQPVVLRYKYLFFCIFTGVAANINVGAQVHVGAQVLGGAQMQG